MLKQVLYSLLVGGTILISSGVNNIDRNESTLKPYLSITETEYTDETQTEMVSNCIVYDLNEQKLDTVGQVPYTSSTPLTTFSSKANSIMFSAYSGLGDQIYKSENNSFEKITNQFSTINYMLQCGDKLFLSARYLPNYCMEPIVIDLSDGTVKSAYPDENDDRFTWAVTCDPINNKAYFTYYSDNEMRENMQNYNYEQHPWEEDSGPIPAPSTFCSVDMNTLEVTPVYTTDKYIWGIAASGDNLYYSSSASGTSNTKDYAVYHVNLKTKEKTKLDLPVHISSNMAIWDNVIYCLGWIDETRGVYSINLDTLEYELIYSSDNGFINGFSLNY